MSGDGPTFSILGSLEVCIAHHQERVSLHAASRVLLARLLVHPGAAVPVDALTEALWGDELKADVRNSLHELVRTTRRLLGDEAKRFRVLLREDEAYRLVADPVRIDALRFRRLADRGGQLVAAPPAAARAMLAEALSTWRGPLLGPLADRGWAQWPAAELERARLDAQIALNEARLSLADHAALARELPAQIERDPEVEPLRIQLVRELHAAGRNGEAKVGIPSRECTTSTAAARSCSESATRWCAASSRRRAGCRPATETATATTRSRAPTPWCCALSGSGRPRRARAAWAARRSSSTARAAVPPGSETTGSSAPSTTSARRCARPRRSSSSRA